MVILVLLKFLFCFVLLVFDTTSNAKINNLMPVILDTSAFISIG